MFPVEQKVITTETGNRKKNKGVKREGGSDKKVPKIPELPKHTGEKEESMKDKRKGRYTGHGSLRQK